MSQIARGAHKAAVIVGQITKPWGIGTRELLPRGCDWPIRILHRKTYCLEENTYQLTYCQKFPNLTTRAVCSNEYGITRGHKYCPRDGGIHRRIKCTVQFARPGIYLIQCWSVISIRPHKQICDWVDLNCIYLIHVWCDTCNINSAG